MHMQSTAPADVDPVYEHMTLSIECDPDKNVLVRVSEAQHVSLLNVQGQTIDEWDAVEDTPHVLQVTSGIYIVKGANDEITINL